MAILRCNKCGCSPSKATASPDRASPVKMCRSGQGLSDADLHREAARQVFRCQRELIRLKSASASTTAQAATQPVKSSAPLARSGPRQHRSTGDGNPARPDLRLVSQTPDQGSSRSARRRHQRLFRRSGRGHRQQSHALQEVVDRIRWSQQKEFNGTTVHLEKRTPDEARALLGFCQQLYDFSFVAKCFHNKQENNIRLILQSAPAIRQFFNGEWRSGMP